MFWRQGFENSALNVMIFWSKLIRGGSRTAATSRMELPAVNYYHKVLHLGCCNSPRSAFANIIEIDTETVTQWCSVKKVFLEILQNSQENTCARVSFLSSACNFIKQEILAQVFSCEFCEISKNTFSYRKPPVTACVDNAVFIQMQLKLV